MVHAEAVRSASANSLFIINPRVVVGLELSHSSIVVSRKDAKSRSS